MCGIFGVVADPREIPRHRLEQAVTRLFLLSETRGKESAGLTAVLPDSIVLQKSAVRPKQFIRSEQYRNFLGRALTTIYGSGLPFAMFGHSRLVTNGSQNVHANNQPVVSGGIVGVHNGIIVNDDALWRTSNALVREAQVDTEVMLQLLRSGLEKGAGLVSSLRETFRQVVGTVTTALAFEDLDRLALATNNGSLYIVSADGGRSLVFASERYILEEFLATKGLEWSAAPDAIRHVGADEALLIDLQSMEVHPLNLRDDSSCEPGEREKQRPIKDETPASDRLNAMFDSAPPVTRGDFRCFEIDVTPIRALRRCTKCILPETVPFISFAADGTCNFCESYVPKAYHGRQALEAEAERLKLGRGKGSADCLFTLSGGRDSSYGLHYAVRELGLKPIAYTYDWGMITDLARRNQARMCGALKVEHILVSADIAKKRDNIRRNVSAWLKKPTLGMIPLFMAGDKQYFYFANDLSRKLKLETTVLASNPLEKTHFKAGFCGVSPSFTHRPSALSQIQMAAYYGREFLRNPGYLNRSLFDTGGAFGSYYFIKHQYLRLFDFVPWAEETVNGTLLNMYDWETASDTNSTWRIGDGTAAFYNYIYYKVAGFSENDTFRSNQIREGVMERDRALRLSETENEPRFESIAWYCSVIGLNPSEVLSEISKIPTLYLRV